MKKVVKYSCYTKVTERIITMDNLNYSIEHKKWQHLKSEERHFIEVQLKMGWNINKIAKALNRSYNTIKNEIKRGTVELYNGKVKRYKADMGKAKYDEHRKNCAPKFKCLEKVRFIKFVCDKFDKEGWSLDACVGNAIETGTFSKEDTVCTKTLYNYVDLGLLPIKNIDLPEKLRRNTKAKRVKENKRKLGKSIEERPEYIQNRQEFGHWEIDSVIGVKDESEPAIMTVVERMTRMALWIKIKDHTADSVNEALIKIFENFKGKESQVFKTITGDNGSEFARLTEVEGKGLQVYFTHPYSSWEKGTNECHNKMLRRFIPKGKQISDYSADNILFFADRINSLPRKILNYRTPEELFERQLDIIYAA